MTFVHRVSNIGQLQHYFGTLRLLIKMIEVWWEDNILVVCKGCLLWALILFQNRFSKFLKDCLYEHARDIWYWSLSFFRHLEYTWNVDQLQIIHNIEAKCVVFLLRCISWVLFTCIYLLFVQATAKIFQWKSSRKY